MQTTLCSCGSGRPFERCHGDPRHEFARRQALLEAGQIALLFPSVRLRAPEALGVAARLAEALGDNEELDDDALTVAAATIEEREARRLVDEWAAAYPDRWSSLCRASADVAAAELELVKGVLEAAVHERLPTPPEVVMELELADPSPVPALALVVPPQFVWSYDEARAGAAARPDRIEEVAAALGRVEHAERVRTLARFLRAELPFANSPRASAVLAEACDAAESDLEFVRAVYSLSLLAYVHELSGRVPDSAVLFH